ncbi:unnamed protein product [Haemonchus placei]|uniref:t-SNARE coiled-coil homology domain-containing protein n=1 Tax=Haemonchus placei TaxID=6290 RepID=A0A0N4VSY6_HAEPC|nr:unnamed protein product [Haemonchus placei]
MPSEEEATPNARTEEDQKKMAAKNQEGKAKPKKRSGKPMESTSAAKRTREDGGTPSSSSYDLWKDFCERGTDAFKDNQKKVNVMERQGASTRDSHLQMIDTRMEKIEKSLADHHEFVKQTVAPTNLVIKPEHVDELLKRVTTSSTEMQSSLEEQMDNAKNRILMEMDEMFKEVDRCRTEVERVSNNAVMHEVREVSIHLATFRTEVNQRFVALEKRLDQMPVIVSTLRRIEMQLKKSDGGDSGSVKEEARRQRTEESIQFSLRNNTNLSREPEQEREKRSRELRKEEYEAGEIKEKREDKEILESMAKVDKDLRRTKHEIFALSHKIEELRREDHKANESKIYSMREKKYELLDEEMALQRKKDDLKMALYEWTRKRDTTTQQTTSRTFIASTSHRYQRSTTPRHGSQKGSPERSRYRTPSHRDSTRRSYSPGLGRRGV